IKTVSEQISATLHRELKEALKNPGAISAKIEGVAPTVLQPGAPRHFKKDDVRSFTEWLQLSSAKPIERKGQKEGAPPEEGIKQKKFRLIEKFIATNPKILPLDPKTKTENPTRASSKIPETLMTETLATVYLQQKNYKKAIQAYKILSLKNPEKSGFFADQIRAIEKLIH
ncbi:MAG: hypothetical protein ACPGQR_01640, partial [Marinirhabdus sp.]